MEEKEYDEDVYKLIEDIMKTEDKIKPRPWFKNDSKELVEKIDRQIKLLEILLKM